MPNTLERSVSASAGMRSAAAAATASSRRTVPPTIQYSLCRRRWTKLTGLRELAGLTELTEADAIMMYNFTRFDSASRLLAENQKSLAEPRACSGRDHRRRLRERAPGE